MHSELRLGVVIVIVGNLTFRTYYSTFPVIIFFFKIPHSLVSNKAKRVKRVHMKIFEAMTQNISSTNIDRTLPVIYLKN